MNKKRVFAIQNKKGLSAIITTLLVVLLVLVAVGIVWAVVRNVISGGVEDIELNNKCLNVDMRATAVVCTGANPDVCDVTLERTGSNTDEIAGVKLVFRDSTAGTNSGVIDPAVENVEHLAGEIASAVATTLVAPDSLEVTVYFEDASGNEKLCAQTTSIDF